MFKRVDIYSNKVPLHNSETSFNSYFIYPFLKATINAIDFKNHDCIFLPGEEPLASMSKRLKLSGQQEDNCTFFFFFVESSTLLIKVEESRVVMSGAL